MNESDTQLECKLWPKKLLQTIGKRIAIEVTQYLIAKSALFFFPNVILSQYCGQTLVLNVENEDKSMNCI